jgi:hypothetical protein
VLDPSRTDEPERLDVLVGIPTVPPDAGGARAAAVFAEGLLREAFPGRSTLAVVLDGGAPHGDAKAGPAVVYTGGHGGPDAALPALLELAASRGAPACALLEPLPRPTDPSWVRALLHPVLEEGFDLVAPSYARGRFEGVLVTGIVYPLTRALFGHRLRHPLGREIVLSRRLGEHLLAASDWRTDPAHAGSDLWVVTKALIADAKVAQVYLGPRPVPPEQPADVSRTLADVLGLVFHEMNLHAPAWQRVRGSKPVATWGEERPPAEPVAAPGPRPLLQTFSLASRELRALWSAVLPPQTLLALQRLDTEPPEDFRMPDALWARIVYDFAVGWRLKVLERSQLLRSLTPLYLGWLAGYANEVGGVPPDELDARLERLCATFEQEKKYLITRWRWPDRFSP